MFSDQYTNLPGLLSEDEPKFLKPPGIEIIPGFVLAIFAVKEKVILIKHIALLFIYSGKCLFSRVLSEKILSP